MKMLDDNKERLAAAQKEAEDPEGEAARLTKLAEILTADRSSINDMTLLKSKLRA